MERKIILFFVALIAVSLIQANAQPIANFTIPPSACIGQNIKFSNGSTSATTYIWDFCNQDLSSKPAVISSFNLPSVGSIFYSDIRVLFDQGVWLGFATNIAGANIVRLNFGANLSSTPSVTDFGNLNGILTSPGAVDVINESGNWYIFVSNIFQNKITRISMGTSLIGTPTLVEDLGSCGTALSTPIGIKLIKSDGKSQLFVTNLSSNDLTIVDFGASFSSSPIGTRTISDPSIAEPYGIDVIFSSSGWYGLMSSFQTNGSPILLSFGSSLFNTPTFTTLPTIPNARQTKLLQEGLGYFGFIRSASNGVYRIQFGINFSTSTVTNLASTLQNDSRSLELVYDAPNWTGLTIEATSGKLWQMNFIGDCSNQTNANSSLAAVPNNIQYLASGMYPVKLTVADQNNYREAQSKIISISALSAPILDFSGQNICAQNPTQFTASTSQPITLQNWEFGDGGTSAAPNPTYTYMSAGVFSPSLTVTAFNGCQNYAIKTIQIFNAPQPNFTLPNNSPLCTNQVFLFTNTSTFDLQSNPVWQWAVNGVNTATTQNLSASFTNTNSQTISLQASIPGCRSTFSQTISSLTPGPLVNFNVPTITCQQSNLTFANSTTGSVTGYQWSFGDGNTSTSTNGSNAYATPGTYSVTLQANNAAGCQNSATKNITIYSKPQPDFSIGLPPFSCSGSASLFTDQTPAPTDSNVTSWQWSFGDLASGTSTLRNPGYLYASDGSYNVSLTATTNFGCGGSVQKAVTISPSPAAAFTNSVACVGQPTQFTEASTGSIRSRLWTIQGNSFTAPNVQFAFVNPGSYPVTLTVTGNNNCVSQFSKTIVVPVAPTLDFSVQAPCNTNPTIFSEITSGSDAPVSQTWNFASLGTGVGATSQFTFSTPGSYSVQLRSTRQSGCAYSIIKSVNIALGPVADFVPSVDIGGPPLPVSFINTSTDATSYLWRFGDTANSTSTQVNANFTFNELGVYAVKLTASNSQGCSFTTSKPITVLVPNINVVLSDFKLVADPSGVLQPMVGITNNGNLPITNPDVLLEVESAGLIRKKISSRVLPAQTVAVPVDLQVVPRSATYICAELVVPNNTADFDRRRCVPLGANEVLFAPYPNPAQGVLNFDWVSTQAQPVSVIIFGPGGSEVLRQQFISVASGLNRLQVKTAELTNGLYYILYSDGSTTKSFCFAVANN